MFLPKMLANCWRFFELKRFGNRHSAMVRARSDFQLPRSRFHAA
jgi:hypothetical protein